MARSVGLVLILGLSLVIARDIGIPAWAQTSSGVAQTTPTPPADGILGTPVPLAEKFRFNVHGDYVAAGIGLRNTGSGPITISLPAGSTIVQAFLYWAVMDNALSSTLTSGTFNGTAITGTLVGSTAPPCWLPTTIFTFRADVTTLVVNGTNQVSLASGVTGSSPGNVVPSPATAPLLEGASLVVVFSNPAVVLKTVIIQDGAVTFVFPPAVTTTFSPFTATGSPPQATTTWIVADGQQNLPGANNRIFVNGVEIANHTLNGAGPGTQLWDTRTDNISAFVPAGTTSITFGIVSDNDGTGPNSDCLTWVAQVFSVTKGLSTTTTVNSSARESPGQGRALSDDPERVLAAPTRRHSSSPAMRASWQLEPVIDQEERRPEAGVVVARILEQLQLGALQGDGARDRGVL